MYHIDLLVVYDDTILDHLGHVVQRHFHRTCILKTRALGRELRERN